MVRRYALVEKLVAAMVEGPLQVDALHLGCDEVPYECWEPVLDAGFLTAHGLATARDLFGYFVARVAGIADQHGVRLQLWDEALTDGRAPRSATIQVLCWSIFEGLS